MRGCKTDGNFQGLKKLNRMRVGTFTQSITVVRVSYEWQVKKVCFFPSEKIVYEEA